MLNTKLGKDELKTLIEEKLRANFGVPARQATDSQIFKSCAILIRELLNIRVAGNRETAETDKRRLHFLSMEFLLGRSLVKNAFNLGILDTLTAALEDMGKNAADIFETEPDAGLGNGGLGRLAACYMDSMATRGVPATGYSICYELGMFRQKLENGVQTEVADNWLDEGESWLTTRRETAAEVRFGGRIEPHWDINGVYNAEHRDYTAVIAVARDMLISGYGTDNVNTLRLWEARSPNYLDMYLFSSGEYIKSLEQRTMAEVITKVLYPADDHHEGRALRIKQQYFFVSATAQTILREHRESHGDVRSFAEHNIIHINDTHPALIIPEIMRILMDEDGLGWDEAWGVVSSCVAYTNHTVMSEALEAWPQGLIQGLLPRIWEILCEINGRWLTFLLENITTGTGDISRNLILCDGMVHMANLCLCACVKVNGVSALHGDILKNELFNDCYRIRPERFLSITNGIDHRRWLAQINPGLHGLVCELLGGDEYLTEPGRLSGLLEFTDDRSVLMRLERIKLSNKREFAAFLRRSCGISLDVDPVFDTQIKRLHEYKRQLMCAMLITHLKQRLHDDPNADFLPRTFIFGAKAASGYKTAKRIIQLLLSLADDIEADSVCRGKLRVVFPENYRVSVAESLMPAAQVSEQISTAGKEASGTGNMKLMMNGAVTIGTLDGANVEMHGLLGDKKMFLFGLNAEEVVKMRREGYDPESVCRANPVISRVLNRFEHGFRDGESYSDLSSRLLYGGDEFMLIADFISYVEAHDRLYATMSDPIERSRIALVNIAKSGAFAADRAIGEYAERIWGIDI